MPIGSVPSGVGAGGALVVVLVLAAFVAGTCRSMARPFGRLSLYLLLGAALLLLAGAPPDALDPEDRRQTALIVALVAGGMLASDTGAVLHPRCGRRGNSGRPRAGRA